MTRVKYIPPENHYIILDIAFATAYGVNEALLFGKLFRLQYEWAGKVDVDGQKWVRLTYEEWKNELPFLSKNTIIRTIEKLEESEILLSKVFSGRSKWYRCNPEYISLDLSTQNGQMQLPKMGRSTTQNGLLPKSFPKSSPKYSDQELIFGYLAKICKIDLELMSRGQEKLLGRESEKFREAGIEPEEIEQFGEWWYKKDWRGKRGQSPTLSQVSECWGQFRETKNTGQQPKEKKKVIDPATGEWTGAYYL